MKAKLILPVVALLFFALPAKAHRLNEYLQATTITLVKDSVSLHVHLTAGSDVAEKILKDIDVNGDGIISTAEQQAYAMLVLGDLHVSIDSSEEPLTIQSWNFSTVKEIKAGSGEIQLILSAAIPGRNYNHHLVFHNQLQQGVSVYLVNCLLPADTTITVTGQSRNMDQSVYSLDFITSNMQQHAAISQQSVEKTDKAAVVSTYFLQGIKHILTGYDHLLFICALVLGAISLWDLVKVVTAFTIAHSITLTLATFGLAHLPGYIVEPFIAASIVFVAVQNIVWPQQASGKTRLLVAFFFGLFHGLGFAGGLLEVMHAMPTSLVIYALLGFTIGVEAGNQLILLPLYGLLQAQKKSQAKFARVQNFFSLRHAASGIVALAGMYYLVAAFL